MPEKIKVPILVGGRIVREVSSLTKFPAERYCERLWQEHSVTAHVGGKWVQDDKGVHFERTC